MGTNLFKPYRTTQDNLSKIPYKAGQLIFTTDTKRIYIDISDAESGRLLASADSFIDVNLGNDKRTLTFIRPDGTTEQVSIVFDIDTELDSTSINPVQNSVVALKINELVATISALSKTDEAFDLSIEQNAGDIAKQSQAIEGINTLLEDLQSDISVNYNESIIGLSVDGQVVTYIKGDGSVHTIVTQDTDTTYSLGTDQVTGLTKLYATTGSAEDGTMTQRAIKTELDKKVGDTIDTTQNALIFTI